MHPSEICTATNRTDVWTDRHFHYHLLPGTELDRMNANFDSDHENACAWLLLNGITLSLTPQRCREIALHSSLSHTPALPSSSTHMHRS